MLYCQVPPIAKMDPKVLDTLTACEHLALSTNSIAKIEALSMPNLRSLSLGRNLLKKIEKLDSLAGSLEELWISYNLISSLDGLQNLTKLLSRKRTNLLNERA